MDILGFKGIWQRYEAGAVLETMQVLERMVLAAGRLTDELEGEVWPFGARPKYRFRFMSDTVFVACWLDGRSGGHWSPQIGIGASLWLLCRITSRLLATATGLGLPFRGCMAAGNFDVRRNFVIGPAVDEAAEWADEADGGFVWLRPAAVAAYEAVDRTPWKSPQHVIYPYDVPLKNSELIRTAVINPRGDEERSVSERDLAKLLGYFDPCKPGVASKLEHTSKFFDFVLR